MPLQSEKLHMKEEYIVTSILDAVPKRLVNPLATSEYVEIFRHLHPATFILFSNPEEYLECRTPTFSNSNVKSCPLSVLLNGFGKLASHAGKSICTPHSCWPS
jgi:hypothetical protein